ncbi:thioesterase family protein [Ectobacillus antri]|uniref:Thioesterase family protein n=1 Tax=Ectobacillus antri TaxID=2486280 RepID=A0ABT6H5J8_9BACI|nr:thioesterase family protein [Ectobacillus antri]MDG4656851.1 thioesterase family protein [Ectobacillus antri]MDG5754252.1 thioesterase family protein [Ectobacillus antri]
MHVSEHIIDIRYAETDQMGVVYHANYVIWLELGRTKLIEDLGLSYIQMEQDGIVSPVLDLQVTYRKAMRYGEKAIVKTWIEAVNPLRVVYGYEILNEKGELCITASTTNILVKKDTFRPVSFKKLYPDWYEIYVREQKNENIN